MMYRLTLKGSVSLIFTTKLPAMSVMVNISIARKVSFSFVANAVRVLIALKSSLDMVTTISGLSMSTSVLESSMYLSVTEGSLMTVIPSTCSDEAFTVSENLSTSLLESMSRS